MYYTRFNTSFCEMIIVGCSKGVKYLHLNTGSKKFIIDSEWKENKSFFKEDIIEINEYLQGKRKIFSIKINPSGTFFQKRVWKRLQKITYGNTKSYKEVAIELNKPTAARAVGMANNKNPIALIIPCHRVISSNGKAVGFAAGIEMQNKLLYLESNN